MLEHSPTVLSRIATLCGQALHQHTVFLLPITSNQG